MCFVGSKMHSISELEVIEESALPSRSMIMAHNPHAHIVANLGENWLDAASISYCTESST